MNKKATELGNFNLWNFIAVLALFIAAFSTYLPEGRKDFIMYLIPIGIVVYSIIIILKGINILNRLPLKERSKNQQDTLRIDLLRIGISAAFLSLLGYSAYVLLHLILLSKNALPGIITSYIIAIGALFLTQKKYMENRNEPTKSFLNILLSTAIFELLCASSFFLQYISNSYVQWGTLLFIFSIPIGIILVHLILIEILIREKNKIIEVKTLKTYWVENMNFKKIVKGLFGYAGIVFIIAFLIVQPVNHIPKIEKVDSCTEIHKYDITDSFLGVYSIGMELNKRDSGANLIMGGILKKDGIYEEIEIFGNSNKSNMQYFSFTNMPISDKFLIIRFYNKNIYLLDQLELQIIRSTCS